MVVGGCALEPLTGVLLAAKIALVAVLDPEYTSVGALLIDGNNGRRTVAGFARAQDELAQGVGLTLFCVGVAVLFSMVEQTGSATLENVAPPYIPEALSQSMAHIYG